MTFSYGLVILFFLDILLIASVIARVIACYGHMLHRHSHEQLVVSITARETTLINSQITPKPSFCFMFLLIILMVQIYTLHAEKILDVSI